MPSGSQYAEWLAVCPAARSAPSCSPRARGSVRTPDKGNFDASFKHSLDSTCEEDAHDDPLDQPVGPTFTRERDTLTKVGRERVRLPFASSPPPSGPKPTALKINHCVQYILPRSARQFLPRCVYTQPHTDTHTHTRTPLLLLELTKQADRPSSRSSSSAPLLLSM